MKPMENKTIEELKKQRKEAQKKVNDDYYDTKSVHCGDNERYSWAIKAIKDHFNEQIKQITMKPTGIELIAIERQEQIEKHGWDSNHDFEHKGGELAKMAAVLAVHHTNAIVQDNSGECSSGMNVWGLEQKLKFDTIHRLKVAGALIAAEIDRLNNI